MNSGSKSTQSDKRRSSYFFNWISLAGGAIGAGSILAFILLLIIDAATKTPNAYLGILAYIVAPFFFALGISLTLLGWILRKRRGKRDSLSIRALAIDLSRPRDRKIALYFALGAAAFLIITPIGSYQTYQFTESNVFCGTVCHEAMQPEWMRSQRSPHANVDCVSCHVGDGAGSYLKAKAGGLRKVMGIITDDFPRPITMRQDSLRAAEDTCLQCHSQELEGIKLETYHHFLSDETNTPFSVSMVLDLSQNPDSQPKGIHWHTNPNIKIEYLTQINEFDENLAVWARVSHSDGKVSEYRTDEYEDVPDELEIRSMECMTCHNRPAHKFEAPNDAIEKALLAKKIDFSLPKIKLVAAEALSEPYDSIDTALEGISTHLKTNYEGRDLEGTIAEVQRIYKDNFFPHMNADWRVYPDNNGHRDSLGCFRCHNEELKNVETGHIVSRENCDSCHSIIAQGNASELENVSWAGFEFAHPDDDYLGLTCADCHTGGLQSEE